MPGLSRWPHVAMACHAGKIILKATCPVAPKKTNASDGNVILDFSFFMSSYLPSDFSMCPPNSNRIADKSLSANSVSPRELKRE